MPPQQTQPLPYAPFYYRFVVGTLLYMSAWSLAAVDIKNLRILPTARPEGAQIFGKIRSHDLLIFLGVCLAAVLLPRLLRTLRWKPVVIGLIVTVYLACVGFIRTGGGNVAFNDDIRVFMIFFVGIIWCRATLEMRNPGLHISILGVAAASMLWGAVVLSPEFLGFSNFSGERVFDPIVFNFSAMSLVFMGILILHSSGRGGIIPLAAGLFILFTQLYVGAGLAATRSIALSAGLGAGVATVFALRLKPSPGSLINRNVITAGIVIAILGMMALAASWTQVSKLFELITDRTTKDVGSADNIGSRISEVWDVLTSLSWDEYILGPGFGRKFPSGIYNGLPAAEVHIGIFTFLLKGGIFLFLALFYLIVIKGPLVAFRSIINRPENRTSMERNLLYTLAGFYGCGSLLFMSGGYTVYCTLGYGFTVGLLLSRSRSELAPRRIR